MGKIDDTYTNPITEYWDWLDRLPAVTREAVLLEDKDADGRSDPDYLGQTIIHILKNSNTYDEFRDYAMYLEQHSNEQLVLYWNIWIAAIRQTCDVLKQRSKDN